MKLSTSKKTLAIVLIVISSFTAGIVATLYGTFYGILAGSTIVGLGALAIHLQYD